MNIKQIFVLFLALSTMIFITIAGINYINLRQHAEVKETYKRINEYNNNQANFLIDNKNSECVIFPRNSDLMIMSKVLDKNYCITINP